MEYVSGQSELDAAVDGDPDIASSYALTYLLIVPVMFAWRSYGWFAYRKIWGNANEISKRVWRYWLSGLTISLVLTKLLKAAPIPDLLFAILSVGIGFSVLAIFLDRFRSWEAKQSRDDH